MKTQKQLATEAVQAAIEESSNVVEMPRAMPQTVQLLPEERLELENTVLKEQLMQAQAREAKAQLQAAQQAIAARVRERTGVDVIGQYVIDIASGTCRLKGADASRG